MTAPKKFSAGRLISGVLLLLATALLVYAVAARMTGTPFRLFGYSFHVVVTDSMTGEIEPWDFIVARSARTEDVEIGDDVVFKAQSGPLEGRFIVHRVVEKYSRDGKTVLRTQGIKEGAGLDEDPVTEIVGRYVWKSALIGSIFAFLAEPVNLIFVIVMAILLLVGIKLIRSIIRHARPGKGGE